MSKPTTYNPRDIAVALQYDGETAPQVTAKGRGKQAEEILSIAEENNIPLHTDPHMVKILAQIPLGEEIPQELYVAVAEILAFAFWLNGKAGPSGS